MNCVSCVQKLPRQTSNWTQEHGQESFLHMVQGVHHSWQRPERRLRTSFSQLSQNGARLRAWGSSFCWGILLEATWHASMHSHIQSMCSILSWCHLQEWCALPPAGLGLGGAHLGEPIAVPAQTCLQCLCRPACCSGGVMQCQVASNIIAGA